MMSMCDAYMRVYVVSVCGGGMGVSVAYVWLCVSVAWGMGDDHCHTRTPIRRACIYRVYGCKYMWRVYVSVCGGVWMWACVAPPHCGGCMNSRVCGGVIHRRCICMYGGCIGVWV